MYNNIKKGDYPSPSNWSDSVKSLLKGIFNTDQNKRFSFANIRSHPWFGKYDEEDIKGFKIGEDIIPTNLSLLKKIEALGLDPDYTQKWVTRNIFWNETMAYYLLYKKYEEREVKSKKIITATKGRNKSKDYANEENKGPQRVDTKASLLTAPIYHRRQPSFSNTSEMTQDDRSGLIPPDTTKIWTPSQKNNFLQRGFQVRMKSGFDPEKSKSNISKSRASVTRSSFH